MSDYYAPSRFARKPVAPLAGAPARPAGRTLADALADPIAVLRIHVQYDQGNRPRWIVEAWNAHHGRIELGQAAQQRLFAQWRERFPALDWWRAHQIDVRGPRAAVGATPEPGDDGSIPEDDHMFGAYRQPVLADRWTPPYPWTVTEQQWRAA